MSEDLGDSEEIIDYLCPLCYGEPEENDDDEDSEESDEE